MAEYQSIGKNHEAIKYLQQLLVSNKHPDAVAVEDLSVLIEAMKEEMECLIFIFCEEIDYRPEARKVLEHYKREAKQVYSISYKTYTQLAEKGNAVGMFCVFPFRTLSLSSLTGEQYPFVVVLDRLEIPGNMGTILRTCDAAEVSLVINVDSTTKLNNYKVVASSRGMVLFHPLVNATYQEAQTFLLEQGYDILLGEPRVGVSYDQYHYPAKVALVVGSERYGIQPSWYEKPHHDIYIPMNGKMNSLNVGVAASLLIYQAFQARNRNKG